MLMRKEVRLLNWIVVDLQGLSERMTCYKYLESQDHLFVCLGLVEHLVNTAVQYLDFFGSLDKQVVAVQY